MEKIGNHRWIATATVVIVVVIVIALVGCALSGKTPQPVSTTPINEWVTELPMIQEPREAPEGNIRGQVVHASDVQSLPNSPLKDALVMAISSDHFASLLNEVGVLGKAGTIGFLRFPIREELFKSYVKASAVSRWDGRYELKVPPGDYVLCLGNIGSTVQPRAFPINVWGCVEAKVDEGKETTLDILQSRGVGSGP